MCYSKGHVFYRCELLTFPDGGAEIQLIEAPDDLRYAQRFPTREAAIQWAEAVRKDVETGRFDP